jgi:hypothetical protein
VDDYLVRQDLSVTCRLVPDLTWDSYDLNDKMVEVHKQLIQDLKDEGVESFSGARFDIWFSQEHQEYVCRLSVPAKNRPEDW